MGFEPERGYVNPAGFGFEQKAVTYHLTGKHMNGMNGMNGEQMHTRLSLLASVARQFPPIGSAISACAAMRDLFSINASGRRQNFG